jgi:hypothetical protein
MCPQKPGASRKHSGVHYKPGSIRRRTSPGSLCARTGTPWRMRPNRSSVPSSSATRPRSAAREERSQVSAAWQRASVRGLTHECVSARVRVCARPCTHRCARAHVRARVRAHARIGATCIMPYVSIGSSERKVFLTRRTRNRSVRSCHTCAHPQASTSSVISIYHQRAIVATIARSYDPEPKCNCCLRGAARLTNSLRISEGRAAG